MQFTLLFIFFIQNFILCQDNVDIQLIEEIAQKNAMEDINLFKYRESYYVPEERILNFNKNYSREYCQLYKHIYLESVDNYYNPNTSNYQVILPIMVGVGVVGTIISVLHPPGNILIHLLFS